MNLSERNILYFDPFYFKNGNKPKPKFFLVVKHIEPDLVLALLPTKVDYVPQYAPQKFGCIDIPEANFNCFKFKSGEPITENEKSFRLDTYLYGHLLDVYSIENLKRLYQIENLDYQLWGTLKVNLYQNILDCLRNSPQVKRKYKALL